MGCEGEQQLVGKHNCKIGSEGKSEMPIVVKKPGNAGGAKGHYWKRVSNEKKGGPLGREFKYGRNEEANSASGQREAGEGS